MKKMILSGLGLLLTASLFAQSKTKPSGYGNNLITFTPASIIDRGIGIGFNYEVLLDDEQKIAFVLPLDIIYADPNNDNEINIYSYISPGMIFYPAGMRKFNYGIGPNLVLGYGSGSEWQWQPQNQRYVDYTNFRMGLMVNNYFLINVTRNFSMQLNAGMGLRYINSYSYNNGTSYRQGINVMGQFKFILGYRF